jgi:exodeoxyribonuclease-5
VLKIAAARRMVARHVFRFDVMKWSPQQAAALDAVGEWLRRGDRPVFRLFGYAGTGKTTLARHIAEQADGEAVFAAFTGKAALVMRAKGCENARTLHSLIYRPDDVDSEAPTFSLNRESDAAKAGLIIVDECSMVDEELGRDLLSFGKPVLVLGDPGQLPPIKGGGFFTEAEPDAMLSEVHRQAESDPIVRLAMAARQGGRLAKGIYGKSRVIGRAEIDAAQVLAADQTLVGLNKTRRQYNQRIRALNGFTVETPVAGDKLVCLRNDRAKGLLNGGLWRVKSAQSAKKGLLRYTLASDDGAGVGSVRIAVLPEFFDGTEGELPWAKRRESDEFDYGYALTVHKAQGSQWDKVVLFDEAYAFREHRARWLYTAITRAAKEITVVT